MALLVAAFHPPQLRAAIDRDHRHRAVVARHRLDVRWHDQGPLYSFIAFSAAAGVITAIASEFLRGAHVMKVQTGKNLFACDHSC